MVIGLWKDLYINILCLILPVVGRSSSTVRGSRTNTDKTLLHDVNERSARDVSRRNSIWAGRADPGVFIMADCEKWMVETDGIEPTT
jgi:hypothetical protein